MTVEAWQVRDTGLVAAAGPFRRLSGLVRHHQGSGDPWPDRLVLELTDEQLVVTGPDGAQVGRWPRGEVTVRRISGGPPVTFVVQLRGSSHLLAAPAGEATDLLVAVLAPGQPSR